MLVTSITSSLKVKPWRCHQFCSCWIVWSRCVSTLSFILVFTLLRLYAHSYLPEGLWHVSGGSLCLSPMMHRPRIMSSLHHWLISWWMIRVTKRPPFSLSSLSLSLCVRVYLFILCQGGYDCNPLWFSIAFRTDVRWYCSTHARTVRRTLSIRRVKRWRQWRFRPMASTWWRANAVTSHPSAFGIWPIGARWPNLPDTSLASFAR